MSEILKTFTVWSDITITVPMKYVALSEHKVPFSDWKRKILVWHRPIYYPNMLQRACHF